MIRMAGLTSPGTDNLVQRLVWSAGGSFSGGGGDFSGRVGGPADGRTGGTTYYSMARAGGSSTPGPWRGAVISRLGEGGCGINSYTPGEVLYTLIFGCRIDLRSRILPQSRNVNRT